MASPKWKGYLPLESVSKNEAVLRAGQLNSSAKILGVLASRHFTYVAVIFHRILSLRLFREKLENFDSSRYALRSTIHELTQRHPLRKSSSARQMTKALISSPTFPLPRPRANHACPKV